MKLLKQAPKVMVFAVAASLSTVALADDHHHTAVGVKVFTIHHEDARGVVWGHGDIRRFHDHDFDAWRGGHWIHDWHDNHFGWWWVVGGAWVFFNAPAYPYPDPYVPSTVIVEQAPSQPVEAAPAAPPAPAPAYWYYCASAQNYYPYVTQCPVGWEQVPATPPAANTAPAPTAAPPPPPPPPPSNDGNW